MRALGGRFQRSRLNFSLQAIAMSPVQRLEASHLANLVDFGLSEFNGLAACSNSVSASNARRSQRLGVFQYNLLRADIARAVP